MRSVKYNRLWRIPPEDLKLDRNEVHIWRASPSFQHGFLSQLIQTLSEDERLKAKRFRFKQDRLDFITRRGILRSILGRYLCEEPSQLHFCYGPYGKPYLTDEFDEFALQFNLAHSNKLTLYAFTYSREIGIDLEYIRWLPDTERIVLQIFSEREMTIWNRLPVNQKVRAFYIGWTRKEAYAKACGYGLTGLEHLSDRFVSLSSWEAAQMLDVGGIKSRIIDWSFETFVPEINYIATISLEKNEYVPRCYYSYIK
jgi:4'-phosphopantetheinyl transferase